MCPYRKLRQTGINDVGNRAIQLLAAGGQPDSLQMALDQILIGQIQQRCLDHAMHHRGRFAEEILIVRATRRAIGHHQRRLAAATGASSALDVIGGCRRHVAQIHRI
ncbi:hypothetical protein AQ766_27335 [Burkholderia pseudomallei]|nr:hypothetical protein AQ766_27335 [Burkholderia pseudomallei]ONE41898.1 hypothetical protein AQ947_09975 [Burkholderia pseudomallei]